MHGRTLLIFGLAALAIAASPNVFAQTSGGASGPASDHHPGQPQAAEKVPASPQGQGAPMGPGMMMRQGQMGPGKMGPGMMMGQGQMGPGLMMGPGMMMGSGMIGAGMMHPGMMMGHHRHHGMMGPWMMGRHGMMMGGWGHGRRLSFSAQDVKRIVDGQLALRGLKHLKAGPVKIVDGDTASADVVTKDGSLALRLRVDRNTGYAVIAE